MSLKSVQKLVGPTIPTSKFSGLSKSKLDEKQKNVQATHDLEDRTQGKAEQQAPRRMLTFGRGFLLEDVHGRPGLVLLVSERQKTMIAEWKAQMAN